MHVVIATRHSYEMMKEFQKPFGYQWRSSRLLFVSTIIVALFAETFLYGFLTPIMSYMLEKRVHIDPSQTQTYTTVLLTSHGFVGLVSAPIIAHLAEKNSSQRKSLLISLAGCLVGTLMIALTSSVWMLLIGRTLQSIAGVGTWVVGFALLAQNEDKTNLGKSMGLAMSSVTAGMVGGPSLSGTLLQLFGYWTAWSVPLAVLALDIAARLIMIEPPSVTAVKDASPRNPPELPMPRGSEEAEETTVLLSHAPSVNTADDYGITKETGTQDNYYRAMLTDARVLSALTNVLVVAILVSGMNNTLPVHLEQTFAWKTLLISMMFFCLQVPNILFSYPAGWLRDRIGIRGPATFGWIAMIPPILLLGTPGDSRFPWAGSDAAGQAVFISSLIFLGSVLPLVRGVGAVQMAYVVKDFAVKDPIAFEPNRSNLRLFSTTEVAYSLGLMIGPILTGSLSETVGFFYMTVTLAAICFVQAVASWLWLDARPSNQAPGV